MASADETACGDRATLVSDNPNMFAAGESRHRDNELVVKLIEREAEWDALEQDWNTLWAASPTASPPLHFDWLREWWRIYGQRYACAPGGLRIVTIWRAGTLVGALPLYLSGGGALSLRPRQLRFLSTGEAEYEETCPDYLNLLCRSNEVNGCIAQLTRVLLDRSLGGWDSLDLCDIPHDSLLQKVVASLKDTCFVSVEERGVCPIADLSGGFEDYLTRLPAKVRQHCRQDVRAASRVGAVFSVARTESDADTFFDQLVDTHQSRWNADGKPGCFASARFTAFHRALARRWVKRGEAVLARLTWNDRPLAVIYGFLARSTFAFYQSGVVHESVGPLKSPGTSALLSLMGHLADSGVGRFDFLRGNRSYKQRLATDECPLVRIRVARRTARYVLHAASDWALHAARKGMRLVARTAMSSGRAE